MNKSRKEFENKSNETGIETRNYFKTLKTLREGKQIKVTHIMIKEGKILKETVDIVDSWREHFENILNPEQINA